MELTLKMEDESMKIKLSELGLAIPDMNDLVKEALAYGKEGSVWSRYSQIKQLKNERVEIEAEYTVDDDKVQKVLEKELKSVNKGTVDATIRRENGQFVITDEVKGITVDMDKAKEALHGYLEGNWKKKPTMIKLATVVDEPRVTRELLEQIEDELGTFTTDCGATPGRVKNLATGASKVNGTVLLPGEELSVGKTTQPYTEENGYAEAGSYLNGEVVQSMGGGICQVSSTLYNAVLQAELEVVQRQPHSMLVSYVKPGMDAAIAGDYKDLKIKNNTDAPIFIAGGVSGRWLTFTIYGKDNRDANRTISYEQETISTTNKDPKFAASNDAIGTLTKVTSEHVGMTIKVWKVVRENGKEVDKVLVNNSKYSASAAVYNVGVKTDNASAAKVVKDAIKTQNESKIKAAISKAQSMIKEAEKAKKEESKKKEENKKKEEAKKEETETEE